MKQIDWPELRFPPINLWVIAALPQAIRPHRQQRPVPMAATGHAETTLHHLTSEGDKRPGPWPQNRQQQIRHLLAMR